MTTYIMYQCDAFTDRLFAGNPGAVMLLEQDTLTPETMQAIADENNLAETAFITRRGNDVHIRYFTPVAEIDLCGHVTLCAAHVMFHHQAWAGDTLTLHTHLAGTVSVTRDEPNYVLNFPAWPVQPIAPNEHDALIKCLGVDPARVVQTGKYRDYLVVLRDENDVATLAPNFTAMKKLGAFVCVTAPDNSGHFVSRFFTPTDGIDEDPVTGSAHCMLVPYWAARLGRRDFIARQLSKRGGTLICTHQGDRVTIAGQVVTFFEARVTL
jgi:PhzF family phenazine biosynthesis protein